MTNRHSVPVTGRDQLREGQISEKPGMRTSELRLWGVAENIDSVLPKLSSNDRHCARISVDNFHFKHRFEVLGERTAGRKVSQLA